MADESKQARDSRMRRSTLAVELQDKGKRLSEVRRGSAFDLVAKGGDEITREQFEKLHDVIAAEMEAEMEAAATLAKKTAAVKRKLKLFICALASLMFVLTLSLLGNFFIIFFVVDAQVTTTATSSGELTVKTTGLPVATTEARVDLPLFASTVLPSSVLNKVKTVSVKYADDFKDQVVTSQLSIVEVRKVNSTFAEFVTAVPGRSLVILNGQAAILDGAGVRGMLGVLDGSYPSRSVQSHSVCSADVTCSAFSLDGSLNTTLIVQQALAELEKVGVSEEGRRRLKKTGPDDDCKNDRKVVSKGDREAPIVDKAKIKSNLRGNMESEKARAESPMARAILMDSKRPVVLAESWPRKSVANATTRQVPIDPGLANPPQTPPVTPTYDVQLNHHISLAGMYTPTSGCACPTDFFWCWSAALHHEDDSTASGLCVDWDGGWVWEPCHYGCTEDTLRATDIWGYTSAQAEYAIIMLSGKVVFVNVATGAIVAVKDAAASHRWYDARTYGSYAYVVTEGQSDKQIQVFDLSNIDSGVVTDVSATNTVGTSSKTHNVVVDEANGFLYRVGLTGSTRGFKVYSLSNPASPSYVGSWGGSGQYIHDAAVLMRGTTQYMLAASSSNGLRSLDVTDKGSIQLLSTATYTDVAVAHSVAPYGNWAYMTDEMIWQDGMQSHVMVFDITNMNSISYVSTSTYGFDSTAHNLYIKGDMLYQSNYRTGVRIYSLSNPASPVEIADYDTTQNQDGFGFGGLWGVFPYFSNDVFVGSDVYEGLFIWELTTSTATNIGGKRRSLYEGADLTNERCVRRPMCVDSSDELVKSAAVDYQIGGLGSCDEVKEAGMCHFHAAQQLCCNTCCVSTPAN